MILFLIILTTFLISLISFVGALTLFLKAKILDKILLILIAFSAGSLLGDAFFHLIPETIEEAGKADEKLILNIFIYLIFGFCIFFILEDFISWHHHHETRHPEIKSFSYLILFSDAVHNLIDGLIIGASFLVSLPLGLASAIAIMSHEIPQEIGDFSLLIYGGFKKQKALFFNFLSGILAIFGGVLGFFLAGKVEGSLVFLLSFAAGSFIYIACSDIIPEIKNKKEGLLKSIIYFLFFLSGLGMMFLIKILFH